MPAPTTPEQSNRSDLGDGCEIEQVTVDRITGAVITKTKRHPAVAVSNQSWIGSNILLGDSRSRWRLCILALKLLILPQAKN